MIETVFENYTNVDISDIDTPIARIGYMNVCLSSIDAKNKLIATKFKNLEVVLKECIQRINTLGLHDELREDLETEFNKVSNLNYKINHVYKTTETAIQNLNDRCNEIVSCITALTRDNEVIIILHERLDEIEKQLELFEIGDKIDYIYNTTEHTIRKLHERCDLIDGCINDITTNNEVVLNEKITQMLITNYILLSLFFVIHYILSTVLYTEYN
jgi:hypothetical protein